MVGGDAAVGAFDPSWRPLSLPSTLSSENRPIKGSSFDQLELVPSHQTDPVTFHQRFIEAVRTVCKPIYNVVVMLKGAKPTASALRSILLSARLITS